MAAFSHDTSFNARMERAAMTLAEEYETNSLRRHDIPINKMANPLTAADVADILLALPHDVPLRTLVSSVETQYMNMSDNLIAQWCLVRQQLEEGEDEKENLPPPTLNDNLPIRLPECAPSSFASPSPRVSPMASSNNTSHPVLKSPLLDPGFSPTHIAIGTDPSSLEPSSPLVVSHALPTGKPDAMPSDGDTAATLPEDVEATLDREESVEDLEASGYSAPDESPKNLSTQGEDSGEPKFCNSFSPSLAASSPQRSSNFAQDLLLPIPRTRLVRSNPVSNFLLLQPSQVNDSAISDIDFFNTSPVDAATSTLGLFNPGSLPATYSVASLGDHNFASPTPVAETGSEGRLRLEGEEVDGPSVVVAQHALGSTVSRNEDGRERKHAREEDEKGGEDGPRHQKRAGGSSVVAGHALGSPVSLDEGGRGRKRSREEAEEDRQERPRQRARHDGFLANLLHFRFVPQYLQYWW